MRENPFNTSHSTFNEATRVQMPALVHLTRLGYGYLEKLPRIWQALFTILTPIS